MGVVARLLDHEVPEGREEPPVPVVSLAGEVELPELILDARVRGTAGAGERGEERVDALRLARHPLVGHDHLCDLAVSLRQQGRHLEDVAHRTPPSLWAGCGESF